MTYTKSQIQAMSLQDITTILLLLTPQEISYLSQLQIQAISTQDISSLSSSQIMALTTTQISYLSPLQISAITSLLTSTQISILTQAQIQALSTAQIQALTTTQITTLLQTLISSQITDLTQTQISNLTQPQITYLIQTLSPEQIQYLTQTQISGLSSQQISGLTLTQIQALKPSQISYLIRSQILGLSSQQILELILMQIQAFKPSEISGLLSTQIIGFSSQIASLTPQQKVALSPTITGTSTNNSRTQITINGINFSEATVTIGGIAATIITSSTNTITIIIPQINAGITSLVVTNPFNTTSISYTYVIPSSVSGSAAGDPYVTTMEENENYKIPNKNANYRLFESDNIIINASVALIKDKYKNEIIELFKDNTIFIPKTNGFYFDKFYININNSYFIFDEAINLLESNKNDEEIIILKDKNLYCDKINGKSSRYYTTIISFHDCICGNMEIILRQDLNPQIINGIKCTISNMNIINKLKGVLVRRSNPRNYQIKSIDSLKPIKIKYETSNNYYLANETWYDKKI